MSRTPPVIGLSGPTAAGKSALAVDLALAVGGEVVSADSVQVYRGFDVGSAKPTEADRRGVPHHLIDVATPDDPMTAGRWKALAEAAVAGILGRGRPAILCGGTGLYFTLLERGVAPIPPVEPDRRAAIERLPLEALVRRLAALDSEAPAAVDLHNRRRVGRAVEIIEATGLPLAAARRRGPPAPFAVRLFALDVPQADLSGRIEARTRAIYQAGLVEETRGLLARWPESCEPLRSVGYREAAAHIAGRLSGEEAERETARATLRLARRQRTWLRHQASPRWIAPRDFLAAATALC